MRARKGAEVVVTRDGFVASSSGKIWTLRSLTASHCFNFHQFDCLSEELVASLEKVVTWYLENKSTPHAQNMFSYFLRFARHVAEQRRGIIEEFTSTDIINFKGSLSREHMYFLSSIAGFLKRWEQLGYPGITKDVPQLLSGLRLPGNRKGEAVRTMDPIKGPLSDIEFEALQESINRLYADDRLSLEEYVLVWLFIALGSRPVQFAALKIADFSTSTLDGATIFTLKVPRAKQRDALPRSEFKENLLIPQIGELLAKHIERVLVAYGHKLSDPSELPIFPQDRVAVDLPGFAFHSTASRLGKMLEEALDRLSLKSERTGKTIQITPRRFRYTLGTRAAMEGAGELVIAELLDHSDTQNVGVYVESRPEIVERIDKAIALQLAPLAQAFCGMLVGEEAQASRGDAPSSRITSVLPGHGRAPVGNCGKQGFCGFAAPVACYTCSKFQPWLEAPHESVLEQLIQERERLLGSGGDLRIASVNDRTILAVAEVVRHCSEIKATQEVV